MPKTLPVLVAVAVIAFSIGFNAARYPRVWEMVGPSAHFPEESGGSESATAPQPAQADELTASIPSDNSARTPSAESQGPAAFFSEQAIVVKAEPAGAESSPPMTNLVPVPSDLFKFNSDGSQLGTQYSGVQRLPPVYEAAPIPAGRYAAEYPQSPITIYPSTGKE
ncbi:MAG: hypothetical protein ABSA26_14950 [Thermoguttaceae bacterium]|jgi:hypothetical protein